MSGVGAEDARSSGGWEREQERSVSQCEFACWLQSHNQETKVSGAWESSSESCRTTEFRTI
jgi:hypothetical protein